MSVYEKMTAIADTIRSLSTVTGKIGLDDMPKGIGEVWDNGHMYGHDEGYWTGLEQGLAEGEEAERVAFWKEFTDKGARTDYSYAFFLGYWNYSNFKPAYDLKPVNGNSMFRNWNRTSGGTFDLAAALENCVGNLDTSNCTNFTRMFESATDICRVGVMDIRKGTTFTSAFAYSFIHTIDKLIVKESTKLSEIFTNAKKLKNITIEGTIGRDINMQWCPLTVESILNIVSHLQCYLNTDYEGTYSLLLSDACWKAMVEYERTNGLVYPDTNLFVREYVQCELGWLTA